MKINRDRAKKAFDAYVANYNVENIKIRLKIEHTMRVAEICEQIAKNIGCNAEDTDLAWFSGLLHDVGRFEQLRKYGTFVDAVSIDHASCGVQVLFRQGHIRDYLLEDSEDKLLEIVIESHNKFAIPEGLDERTEQFCHILRDADKVDIFKVNVTIPVTEIYDLPVDQFEQDEVTEAVMESFSHHSSIERSLKKTAVDHIVGHIALVYDMVYPISIQITKEQGYLKQLMSFSSKNPVTQRQFELLNKEMELFI